MQKNNKIGFCIAAASMLSLGIASIAFAGEWHLGEGSEQGIWRYANDDGTFARNGWYWIDGNADGISECYYFDANGLLLVNTSTPDGWIVNENGAWSYDGAVQTRAAEAVIPASTESANQTLEDGYSRTFYSDRGGEAKIIKLYLNENGKLCVWYGSSDGTVEYYSNTYDYYEFPYRSDQSTIAGIECYSGDVMDGFYVMDGAEDRLVNLRLAGAGSYFYEIYDGHLF